MKQLHSKFRLGTLLAIFALLVVISGCGNSASNSGNSGNTAKAAAATENANATEAAAAVAEEATPAPAAAEELPTEIRIGYQVSPNGELLAKSLDLLEKKYPDIKISWLKFDSGRDVNVAIASGGIDFGLLGTPPGASGVAQGLPDQIYYIHDVIGESEALVVKSAAGISSLAELKGHKIATTFGSTSHFSLLSALKQENIDPASITILDMQAPTSLPPGREAISTALIPGSRASRSWWRMAARSSSPQPMWRPKAALPESSAWCTRISSGSIRMPLRAISLCWMKR